MFYTNARNNSLDYAEEERVWNKSRSISEGET